MGAYLSSPVCEKETHEGANNRLAFAASSMQGWRMSQEDAHNAILNFDENTSLFAVYDGHGGSEIAVYCSRYLPEFLKKLNTYQEGRLNEALIESFLKFDSVLLDSKVKKVLQKLANDEQEESDQAQELVGSVNSNPNDQSDAEEAQLLKKEAELPIEELLKRYNGDEKHFHSPNVSKRILNSDSQDQEKAQPSSSEPKSTERRIRKPVSENSPMAIESNSLTRHLINDNTDELDDDDDDDEDASFDGSEEEETSGDEAEDHDIDEENGEDEDKPLDSSKTTQFQTLMRKSIMAILNRQTKKKKIDGGDDSKENQDEENDGDEDNDADEDDDAEEEEEDEDLGMLDMENDPGSSSGCTAVVTLLRDKQLLVANAGDSRCVVCRAGRAIEMSVDHKPEDPEERSRIEKAGYKVTVDGRVSGGLNLSRAIGDHAYKKKSQLPAEEQAITALPDVRTLTLDEQDEFMIIACDGIWNFMSSQDVIDFVHHRLEKKSLSQICEELFMHCLAPNTIGDGTGCDNMTTILVKFNFNSPSSVSTNSKRPLSTETIESSTTSKKLKILTENVTIETITTEQIPS